MPWNMHILQRMNTGDGFKNIYGNYIFDAYKAQSGFDDTHKIR